MISEKRFIRLNSKDLPSLNYGMVHCRFGDAEGVSIVMSQIEGVLNQKLKIPKDKIFYFVGKSKIKNPRITEEKLIFDQDKTNRSMQEFYKVGYNEKLKKEIRTKILKVKNSLKNWIKKNNIDILIVHNSSHPVNFISSLAINKYYEEAEKKREATPKYILWWHDSHLERKSFAEPSKEVEKYILQGVPGKFVEYIIFINSLQFRLAKTFLKKLNQFAFGFYNRIRKNHTVGFNTSEMFIEKIEDLKSKEINELIKIFIRDFKIEELVKKHNLDLSETLFILQPTRIVDRKRIDFSLRYCYKLLEQLKKRGLYKSIYFLISGHDADKTKEKLTKLNEELKEEYKTEDLILSFAEDTKTSLKFLEYPRIFAGLGGISTYFSEIEGFGNNLLEVLASGLIPIIYTYPVFKKDIAKFRFKLIKFKEFQLDEKNIERSIELIKNKRKKERWIKRNLKIMKRHFSHDALAPKIKKAILSRRKII